VEPKRVLLCQGALPALDTPAGIANERPPGGALGGIWIGRQAQDLDRAVQPAAVDDRAPVESEIVIVVCTFV